MADNPGKLLKQAAKAYQNGQKRQGAVLVEKVLMGNFNHPEAWHLLHKHYGPEQPFETFRRQFAEKYYPDKAVLLMPIDKIRDQESGGFLASLFRRKPKPKPEFIKRTPADEISPDGNAVKNPHSIEARLDRAAPSIQPAPEPAPAPRMERPAMRYPDPKPISSLHPSSFSSDDLGILRVMVVDDIQQTRESVIRTLQFQEQIEVVATATNGRQAIEKARETRPDVILMDVNMPDMDGISATKSITQIVPTAQIVILTVQDDPDYMRKAMLAGARDFLTKPPTIDDLLGAVQRAGALAREAQLKAPPAVLPSAASPAKLIPQQYGLGKIITLYSPKGGAGCTLLAANLAVALNNDQTRVAIVDGNLQFGDIPVLFNEKSVNSIADLAPRATELDPEIINEVMITHKKTGIKILASPKPEYAEGITGEQFATTLKYLRKLFGYVIVDTSRQLSDVTIAALEASDVVLLLTTQDIPAIASSRKFLDLLPLLKFDSQRILVAMNQFNQKINIDPQKVGDSFQKEIASVIPNDARVVIPSINRGIPFMLQSEVRSKPIAQSVLNLAEVVRERLIELNQIQESVPA